MSWIKKFFKVTLVSSIFFYLSLVIGDYFLSNLLKDYSISQRYKLAQIDKKTYPLYSAWNFWTTKNGPFVEIDQNKLFILTTLSNTSTIYCNEGYGWIKYKSDSYGFRNDKTYKNLKVRVNWLIGDSFVHGACVKENQTINSILEKQHYRSVNLGIGGNGVGMGLGILKEIAEVKANDNVLFFYYEGNDIPAIRGEITDTSPLTKYLQPTFKTGLYDIAQEEVDKRVIKEIESNYEKLYDLKENKILNHLYLTKITNMITNVIKSLPNSTSCEWYEKDYTNTEFDNFFKVIQSAKTYSELKKANLYLIYLPSYQSIFLDCKFAYERIIKRLNREKVYVLDMRKLFLNSANAHKFFSFGKKGGHYSSLGYKSVSDNILRNLKNNETKGEEKK